MESPVQGVPQAGSGGKSSIYRSSGPLRGEYLDQAGCTAGGGVSDRLFLGGCLLQAEAFRIQCGDAACGQLRECGRRDENN